MFLAHFMGDVHDPVDVSFYDDEGGIFIIVYWYGSKTNLHKVSSLSFFLVRIFCTRERERKTDVVSWFSSRSGMQTLYRPPLIRFTRIMSTP